MVGELGRPLFPLRWSFGVHEGGADDPVIGLVVLLGFIISFLSLLLLPAVVADAYDQAEKN